MSAGDTIYYCLDRVLIPVQFVNYVDNNPYMGTVLLDGYAIEVCLLETVDAAGAEELGLPVFEAQRRREAA